jgi:hypothetical protein
MEPFVSAEEAAQFLSIKRRYLLALARSGIAGAYALGMGFSSLRACRCHCEKTVIQKM